ncbi:ammonium transporter AmtB-like domain-containing protein [Globomyces pollinis-pini]|nr:ammonium transporter AmtB-like domain-containing protein [Globomyces pollinis-pini]
MATTTDALSLPSLMPAAFSTSLANNATHPIIESGFASTGFMLTCSALVMIMTPAVGIFYSGLSGSKNALNIIMISFLAYAVITLQWVVFGFSFAFSETSNPVIGNFDFIGFKDVLTQALPLTATAVPVVVFALYQLQFATVTGAIIFGSVVERIRLVPSIIFLFFWTTLVYDPIAYWTWAARGWIRNMSCLANVNDEIPCQIGGLDFAGGGPVHMASGAAALAFCLFVGRRKATTETKPHNVTNVFLGTALLWFGWFGFNGGSAGAATARAGMAAFVTTVAASAGGLTWMIMDAGRTKKLSGVGFCSGAIAGLVGITPASGFVAPWAAIIIGVVSAAGCNLAIRLKEVIGYDDTLDAFGLHGVGGLLGSVLTGLFASKDLVASLDGGVIKGGAIIDGNWVLVAYQLAGSAAILVYSFAVTYVLLLVLNIIPGLNFRVSAETEEAGADFGEMGEIAYEIVSNELPNMKTVV